MHTFLQFAFNADNLRENLREPWMEFYDYIYIDEKIIGGIERSLPNIQEIIKSVEKRATGKVTSTLSVATSEAPGSIYEGETRAASAHGLAGAEDDLVSEGGDQQAEKKVTKIEPFNLTKPKPKLIQQPEPMKREVKANPVPSALYKLTLADIEQQKKERRQKTIDAIKQEYEQNPKKKFELATMQRPTIEKVAKAKADNEKLI
jgi:hypothetical protein